MHGTTMVFFVGMPILIGIANYHRAAADRRARHGVSADQCVRVLGHAVRRAAGVFQFFYSGRAAGDRLVCLCPADGAAFNRGAGVDFWALGLLVSGIGTIAAGVNFVATILSMRCPGMTLGKVPFFTWTMLWTSVQILLAIPPLTAALSMVEFDRPAGGPFLQSAKRRLGLSVAALCFGSSDIPRFTF